MKETRPIRKKMLDMRFEYHEALWNPETTLKDLQEMMKKNKPGPAGNLAKNAALISTYEF